MISLTSFLTLAHLIGLVLGVGAATVKLRMLLKCTSDLSFVPTFLKISKFVTRQIILGLVLLTLSGIGWLFLGYGFSSLLILKICLVLVIWIIGPVIDNVIEPKFSQHAPAAGEKASPEFIKAQKQYLLLEMIATLLFYVVIIIWMWS